VFFFFRFFGLKHEGVLKNTRLHFATHGLIDDANPTQSSVLMTLDGDPREDGFLEVSEIMDLDLDCDLVVLSACQTARGKIFSGEGVVGLSRAFLYAGARSVAVSLWNVGDISTGQLMKSFYSKMKPTTSNAAALREAQLEMLHGDLKWQHPYYWAPFILVGKY
jgi:CHAT domain-containing protein